MLAALRWLRRNLWLPALAALAIAYLYLRDWLADRDRAAELRRVRQTVDDAHAAALRDAKKRADDTQTIMEQRAAVEVKLDAEERRIDRLEVDDVAKELNAEFSGLDEIARREGQR